ncbi:MAG TPA: NIPSNAP family protein [Planctomycetaceae bacterium]|nr:NIPSNAP family protein [Planctomycetaceae bacterium]
MNRRTFLQASAVAGCATLPSTITAADAKTGGREFFELRAYTLRPGKLKLIDGYFQQALLPALNRLDIKPVGVFFENAESDTPTAYLLIRYASLSDYATTMDKVTADAAYQSAAADYLAVPATDAVYDRIESSLLGSIEGLPALAPPPQGQKPRLFNLRIYESHNEAAAKKKVEMFNRGELDIFRRVGLTPMLFGEALIGSRLPNLTYLLVYDDDAARQAAWNTFRSDPQWQKLRAIPEYEDKRIVSKITNKLLTPAEYSQI